MFQGSMLVVENLFQGKGHIEIYCPLKPNLNNKI